MMEENDWRHEIELLQRRGIALMPGLTAGEFVAAERQHGFQFPPDLRSFLGAALPVGVSFPDWRVPGSASIREQLSWPFEGIAFDVEHNGFWFKPWGPRPESMTEAVERVRALVGQAPQLVPIYGHRYLAAEPPLPGNPVLSIYQTDIIYYGTDLRQYISCEFGGLDYAEAIRSHPRRIRFWSDLADNNS